MKQTELFECPVDMLAFEQRARNRGHRMIAGIDEAGRGALAGPVVAAAVILPVGVRITGVNDSKKLSPKQRDELYGVITAQALRIGVGVVTARVIDRVNILQATRLAMQEAVSRLSPPPDYLLIDGITPITTPYPQKTVIKGDSLSLSIAAASIIAKVTRDRLMQELDLKHPGYGFAAHKGYGSEAHLEAIRRLGPSPVHRRTFSGVTQHLPCPSS